MSVIRTSSDNDDDEEGSKVNTDDYPGLLSLGRRARITKRVRLETVSRPHVHFPRPLVVLIIVMLPNSSLINLLVSSCMSSSISLIIKRPDRPRLP